MKNLFLIATAALRITFEAFVPQRLGYLFIVPLGLPAISLPWAVGVLCVSDCFRKIAGNTDAPESFRAAVEKKNA